MLFSFSISVCWCLRLHAALLHVGSSDEEGDSDVELVWHRFACEHTVQSNSVQQLSRHLNATPFKPEKKLEQGFSLMQHIHYWVSLLKATSVKLNSSVWCCTIKFLKFFSWINLVTKCYFIFTYGAVCSLCPYFGPLKINCYYKLNKLQVYLYDTLNGTLYGTA